MQQFGRYTLIRKVGAGGMAEIWKARASGAAGFERIIAIKKVLPDLVEEQQADFVDMFIAEAKLAAGLVHPNIVQVFDFGQVGRRDYFIAMEYVAGGNLARLGNRLARDGIHLPTPVALYIGAEVARGLGHAHGRKDETGAPLRIVHRDISPQNILVSSEGEVKVADFGIAKVASTLGRTAEGKVRGKLAYMSPEQARAQPMDHRSDLFSLGVVLFEAMARKRFFPGPSSSEVYSSLLAYESVGNDLLDALPPEMRPILAVALEPDRDKRFPNATAMEAAFAHELGARGAIEARQYLATLVQHAFREELAQETAQAALHAGTRSEAALDAEGEMGAGGEPGAEAGEPSSVFVPTVPTPTGLRGNSGLTVAPSQVVLMRDAGPTRPRAWMPYAIGAGGTALLAGLFFAGHLLGSGPLPTSPPPAAATGRTAALASPAASAPAVSGTIAAVAASPAASSRSPSATPFPAPAARMTRAAPAVPAARAPVTRAPAPPSSGIGTLSVSARPWVQVYVDGKLVAKETPLPSFDVPAGRHTLRFVNAPLHFDTERTLSFSPGTQTGINIDVRAKTVDVK